MHILFITSNRIGDAVLTTGLLAWLESTYPTARFTIACGPVAADLFRATPRLENIILLKKKKHHMHWVALWRQCVGRRWDLIVDLRNSAVSRLLLAKQKRYKLARGTGNHKIQDHAKAMGLNQPPAPFLWTDEQAEDAANKLMPSKGAKTMAFGPAANWPAKQWQIEKFIRLAQTLVQTDGPYAGAHILIAAAPQEKEQVQPFLDAFPAHQIINIIGQDLLAVTACLKRCALFIGNDSGLMHMASAVGTPTLGLFGPTNENIYGPWGPHTRVVRTPESTQDLVARLPWPGAFHPNLMESLSVEAVHKAALELIQKTKRP